MSSSSSSRRWASASVTDLSSAGRSPLPAAALSPEGVAVALVPCASRVNPLLLLVCGHHARRPPRRRSLDAPPAGLWRQRSCTELPGFADADAEARKVVVARSGGHASAIGRSMRLLPSTRPAGVTLTPGRVAPSDLRRLDAGADVASSGSECSDASRGGGGSTPRTTTKLPKPPPSPLIARTNSTRLLGSSNTQWALSPGRRSGSPLKTTLATVPELKGKTKSLIGLGWGHLFSRRKAAAAETATGAQATATLSSPASRRSGGGGNREIGHQMKMMHCRLLQWRFANAKAEAVSKNKLSIFEVEFMGAWARISELQGKVARRRVQLEKEKLKIKLNSVLSSQMRGLESWGQLESKHAVALDSTVVCTQAAICKLPLTNGAKAHDTTLLITELVAVAREEHALLQECLELLGRVSALQVEEESLRCHMLQS
ncbi:hypothetical protein OsJ_11544 [Oryza sativa Japonica Group]|uniref:Uncharacterized protein n=1 Tax=Oryza sativa subsp. japonica TaxID=39947 RepID=B9F9F4_ORYSJ|nr:hypothetical protein OsJ_11544 [Oryza sativa Japonica Group]